MAAKETVSVAPRLFFFVHRYLDNRDNRPQNTCVSFNELGFFSFS